MANRLRRLRGLNPWSEAGTTDQAAKAGLILGAVAIGVSFQPNLLTRGTRDQAIITGLSAATAYGIGVAGSSILKSIGRYVPVRGGVAAEAAVTVGSAVGAVALKYQEHSSRRRDTARIVLGGTVVLTAANMYGRAIEKLHTGRGGRGQVAVTVGGLAAASVSSYLACQPWRASVGAQLPDGTLFEDSSREVNPIYAPALGVGIGGVLLGLAFGESALSAAGSRVMARLYGGSPEDHRTAGRVLSLAASLVAGRYVMGKVVGLLSAAGEEIEAGHDEAPTIPEVTGSPASGIPWSVQSREGRRWLSSVLTPDDIEPVMGPGAVRQPIRAYAALGAASDEQSRAQVLLDELERTGAYERKYLALFSPTGSGYVNYVATETLEYLSRGDCASAAIEYSVLPSSFSLQAVPTGIAQTRIVLNGIVKRLLSMDPAQRPQFFMFGESLGSQVSQGVFTGQGVSGPEGAGLDAAIWIGTPSASEWRKQLWGERSLADAPALGPGRAYLPRSIADWHNYDNKNDVQWLLLQNGDDPIPKFGTSLAWRQPDWLGPSDRRPIGCPRGTRWIPAVTFYMTFVDMLNALTPTPGIFAEGGHDYRDEIPGAIASVFGFQPTDEEYTRLKSALQDHELAWEMRRAAMQADAEPDPVKRAKKQEHARAEIARWLEARDVAQTTNAIRN